jgi:light-regulated signal transduction histidine kinase (bacteriophytochrome)
MSENIALKHILEGLIHNLNNPLNLVLGYAQRIKQEQPENQDAEKIYQAGIRMDDILRDISAKLWDNSYNIKQTLCLNEWLDTELRYLQNHLQIKHHVLFERDDTCEDARLTAAPLMLSQWYETVLGALLCGDGVLRLGTGVCQYQQKAALYIRLDAEPTESEVESLLMPSGSPLTTIWDAESRSIYGVCG